MNSRHPGRKAKAEPEVCPAALWKMGFILQYHKKLQTAFLLQKGGFLCRNDKSGRANAGEVARFAKRRGMGRKSQF